MRNVILFIFALCIVWSCEDPAQTGDATEITNKSAILSGRVVVAGEKNLATEGGVFISETEGIFPGTTPRIGATSFDRDNNFKISVDELEEGTTYYYCTYLLHKGKIKMGEIKSFTTKITPKAEIDRIVYSSYIKKGAQRTIGIITDSDCEISVDSVDPDIASGIVQDNNKLVVSGHSEGLANFVIHFPETEAYMGHEDINLKLYIYNGEILADLGLSDLWAKCNIGATKPEEFGDLYAWGEITSKDVFTRESYSARLLDKYYVAGAWATYGKQVLDNEDDVAHVKLGDHWNIPYSSDWEHLADDCNWSWVTINGIQGYKITGKNPDISDDWIFLPAAGKKICLYDNNSSQPQKENEICGEYWARNMNTKYQGRSLAYIMTFNSSSYDNSFSSKEDYRCNGHSIRPVFNPF